MLGVTFTSRSALEDGDSRRKKDKKEKKKKKSKREKKEMERKRKGSGSDDSSSDDDAARPGSAVPGAEPAAADNGATPGTHGRTPEAEDAKPAVAREDWMTKPMRRDAPKPSKEELEEQRKREVAAAEPEIFPGLRIMKKPDPAEAAAGTSAAPSGPGPTAAGSSGAGSGSAAGAGAGGRPGGVGGLVGDGGASWRLKALKRAQEQARAEGRSLQEVVGERWGSLAQLTQDLAATAAADGKAHLRAAAERRRAVAEGLPPPAVLPHYLQDVRGERAKMMRPSDDASLSWRRDSRDNRDRERDRNRDRENTGTGDRDPERDPKDRDSGGQQHREGGGDKDPARGQGNRGGERRGAEAEPDRGRARPRQQHEEKEEEAAPLDGDGARRGHPREQGGRERQSERDGRDRLDRGRGRDGDRTGDRDRNCGQDRDRDRDRARDRPGREPDGDRDRGPGQERRQGDRDAERERERPGERRGAGAGRRHSREQAAVLQQLAGALNNFSDDGSFMERFMAQQQRRPQQQRGKGEEEEGVEDEGEEEDGVDGERAGPSGSGDDGGGEPPSPSPGGQGRERRGGATGGSGGGGNRAVAELLRGRAGGGAGCEGGGGARAAAGGGGGGGAEERPASTAPRRAPLFVGGEFGDDGGDGAVRHQPSAAAGPTAAPAGNKSAAELLRARLKGLPPPPQAAAAAGADPGAGPSSSSHPDQDSELPSAPRRPRELVQLPLVDAQGRAVRGAFGREAAGAGVAPNAGKRAGTKAPQRYNRETGEKERYFADDDKVDLQTMLRRAKYGDEDMDMDAHVAANIAKKRKFRETDLDADAEYDFDGGVELYESRTKRGNAEAQRNRDRGRQVADLRKQAAAEAGCVACLSNPKRPPHLTVSVGNHAYLGLPPRGRLVRGHCVIAPAEHLPSIRGLDEGTWTEVKNFIKCLVRMYGEQGQSVLFMETYMARNGPRNHAVLDVVPMTDRQLEKARGYFKKAILEAESEWSTHHAKACIDTTAQKGLRESIPPNFPYFYVQFGYGSGYVHVIDDESKFDPNFGRQVLVGLLDLPPELTHQRQRAESAASQQQWLRELSAQWDPFDWTRQLHE